MKLWPLFTTCLRALTRNPMRAALTVLGIVIGIAAVVAIMEIGEGSKQQISEQIASLGADTVSITGASASTSGVSSGAGGRASLFAVDAQALMDECPEHVVLASPVVRASGQIIARGINWSPQQIQGGNEYFLEIDSWKIEYGSPITKEHVDNAARVCVIGSTIANKLFAGIDPIGQDIRIKDVIFNVVGVLETKGAGHTGNDQDDCLILPWTSIRMRLQGASGSANSSKGGAAGNSNLGNSNSMFPTTGVSFYPGTDLQPYANAPHPMRTRTVDSIMVKINNKTNAQPAMDAMTTVMRSQHGLQPGQVDDFDMRDRAQFSKMVTSTADTMSALLLSVAMISLVVGGVGIMNIMMVSVTERTREIGLRMAVGARPRDIMWQFLLEAVLLCLTGGIIGIMLGRGASMLVSSEMGWPTVSSASAMLLSVTVAAGIGIIFGWYPAWKASRMDPIDALRHE